MKIITKLSLFQLKLTSGSFLTYLRRRGVHMNYAQLGVFDTVTLGWVVRLHPSFSYRDEMKERLIKLMKGEHSNLQYALFTRPFHYTTDKNKRITTRGITIQIMKSDNISPAKFREDMVQQWQQIEKESGNPLGGAVLRPGWPQSGSRDQRYDQHLPQAKPVPTRNKNETSSQPRRNGRRIGH
jgi:hypothetical protein